MNIINKICFISYIHKHLQTVIIICNVMVLGQLTQESRVAALMWGGSAWKLEKWRFNLADGGSEPTSSTYLLLLTLEHFFFLPFFCVCFMAQHSLFLQKEEPVVLMTGLSFTGHFTSVLFIWKWEQQNYRWGWYSDFFRQTIELGQVGRMEKRGNYCCYY